MATFGIKPNSTHPSNSNLSVLLCLILNCLPDSPVTLTMKQTVSLPTLVQAYRPESLGEASRICSTSCSISVRLLRPRELPSLVQVMVSVTGRGQLSFSNSPGCTEHTVGLKIWYLFDASAEQMWKEFEEEVGRDRKRLRQRKGAKKEEQQDGRGRKKPEFRRLNTTHHLNQSMQEEN